MPPRKPLKEQYPTGMIDRITFRTGTLARAAFRYCQKNDIDPSELGRIALAKLLNTEPPKMIRNYGNLVQFKKMSQKRIASKLQEAAMKAEAKVQAARAKARKKTKG